MGLLVLELIDIPQVRAILPYDSIPAGPEFYGMSES